ncbi:MAG: hypothetical protein RLZZ172_1975 [Bacteroidota bacterium]
MKKAFLCFTVLIALHTQAQKLFSEGTVIYSVEIHSNDKSGIDSAHYLLKVKGANLRTELRSTFGKSIYIYDLREGMGAVIREFGGQRILIPVDRSNWNEITGGFRSMNYAAAAGDTTILDYRCLKLNGEMADGSFLTIWYTEDILPEIKEINFPLTNINGLPLVIEMRTGEQKVIYSVQSINYDPVQVQNYDIPKNGYKVLTFKDSKIK